MQPVVNRKWLVLWLLFMIMILYYLVIPTFRLSGENFDKTVSINPAETITYVVMKDKSLFEKYEITFLEFKSGNNCNFMINFLNSEDRELIDAIHMLVEGGSCRMTLFHDEDRILGQLDSVEITNQASSVLNLTIEHSLYARNTAFTVLGIEWLMIFSYYTMVWRSGNKGLIVKEGKYGIFNVLAMMMQILFMIFFTVMNIVSSVLKLD